MNDDVAGDGFARPPPSTAAAAPRDRAVSAVVGKALEAAIVVLYISLLIATLYGGAVPEYQETAGAEVGERVLAEGVLAVGAAVPADHAATATVRHDLPRTIDGEAYRIVAANDSLTLVHEDDRIGGTQPLALPADVRRVEGEWTSTADQRVVVERVPDGRIVRLAEGSP